MSRTQQYLQQKQYQERLQLHRKYGKINPPTLKETITKTHTQKNKKTPKQKQTNKQQQPTHDKE